MRMLFAVGCSHKTAPLALRERLSVAPERIAERLDALLENDGVTEAVLLTTCNRNELYAIAEPQRKRRLIEWLGLIPSDDRNFYYAHEDAAAARHLFRVAAGLDSMVVGETQILGQVKTAYLEAHRASAVGPELHRLFQHAFEAAKVVRGDASLNAPRSLPYAAIKLARARLGGSQGKTALVLGAGKTAETLAFHLHTQSIGRLLVANRSRAGAETLAMAYGGEAIALDDVPATLATADLLVCATASERPLITPVSLMQRNATAPLLILDLAVPRDVSPEVASVANVSLVSVDDLAGTIAASAEMRYAAIGEAERAIERAMTAWHKARRIRIAVPTICALRAEAAHVRRQTLAEARRIAAARGTDAALEYLAATLSNRLMHAPT
ncbi:MAG: glutamyl-tRNA reductase, partial [Gammaproteobacteria bacterium]